jgi:hypothetical protein
MQFDSLIRCYRVGGYDVLSFTPPFRKVNNIRFSVGLICGWYVKENLTLTRLGVKLAWRVFGRCRGGTLIENLILK